ncbi:MAG: ABC transporter permease subunit [Mycoplasmatales bacterium]|nr:ABC transporter permease subunit [Mycoplasmatales bacterium]
MNLKNFKNKFLKNKGHSLSFNKRLLFLLPYFIGSLIFIVFPIVILLIKSSSNIENQDNLLLLKQKSTWETMFRSIYLGLSASFISLIIAFPFTFIVSRSKSKTFKILSISLIISPLFVFSIAKVFSLRILLLQIFDSPESIDNSFSIILGMTYLYMPFIIIPIYSVMSNMPESLIEASSDIGYGKFKTITKIVIPYVNKAIFSGLAVVFMLSATTLVISTSLLGHSSNSIPNDVRLIGNDIDKIAVNMRQNPLSAAYGSSLALVTILIMMSVYGLIYFMPILIGKIKRSING